MVPDENLDHIDEVRGLTMGRLTSEPDLSASSVSVYKSSPRNTFASIVYISVLNRSRSPAMNEALGLVLFETDDKGGG